MSNKHMKRCSISLIIKAIKIQNHNKVSSYTYQIHKIKTRLTKPSVSKIVEQLKLSYTAGENAKIIQLLWKIA